MAVPLLLLGIGGGGVMGWAGVTSYNWYGVAPDWLLEDLASSPDPATQTAALTELATRMAADALGGDRADRLVVQGLAVQADVQTPWLAAWGSVLDAGLQAGRFSPEQFDAYVRNGLQFALRTRARVRQGEQAMFEFRVMPARLGPGAAGQVDAAWGEVRIDGESRWPSKKWGSAQFRFLGPGSTAMSSRPAMITGELGKHELTATAEVAASLTGAPGAYASRVVTFTQSLSTSFEIVPLSNTLVKFVDDPSIAAEMARAITVPRLTETSQSDNGVSIEGGIRSAGLPMPFACDVYIRDSSGELHLWRRMCLEAGIQAESGYAGTLSVELGETADLVFRASEQAALSVPGFDLSWDGEIVLVGVPVTRLHETD